MRQVVVSILNYNSAESTIDCVRSLLAAEQFACGEYSLEILVADNASAAQDREYLQQEFPDLANVRVEFNSENLGFATGHNRNLSCIFQRFKPDFVWLLNNDCMVYKETPLALIQSAVRHTDVGIWGATLIESDGETIQCAGGCLYNYWVSYFRQHGRGTPLSEVRRLAPVDFDYIAGASLFFPVATLQKGLRSVPSFSGQLTTEKQCWLNETFFLYFEELDLAHRLKPGYRMAWCKKALVVHVGGISTGGTRKHKTELAEYHSTLSALKFTRLYHPQRLWFVIPARFLSNCLLIMFRREPHLIGAMTRAYRDFWSGN